MMQLKIIAVLLLLIITSAQEDEGTKRLNQLRQRSLNSTNRIINFTLSDYSKYLLIYPRPYDVVIFFDANHSYSQLIFIQYEYLVVLYRDAGAIDSPTYPTFFAKLTYTKEMRPLFQSLEFDSAPNLMVSKPHMAVISEGERKSYLKEYKWKISQTDGQVTTHKLLEFVNKRTRKQVEYKQTEETVKNIILAFIGASIGGVIIYTFLKVIWNHWIFWLLISLAVYVTCCSGIVYCTLHSTPFQGKEDAIIAGGGREQYGLEGWVISGSITAVGLLLVIIAVVGEKCRERYSVMVSVVALVLIYFLITHIELIYGKKSWYGPSFMPPSHYLKGPLSLDQGNNI